jgi:hypothetical protein
VNELKTISEWEKETCNIGGRKSKVRILDPDGFDRRDPDLYKRLFTREEFEQGMIMSTIEGRFIE